MLKERLMKLDQPLVENIDWKVKWVCGSSKLASLSQPLARIDLHCLENSKGRSTCSFEMNLDQVSDMIQKLEEYKEQCLK